MGLERGVAAVVAGTSHSCALEASGSVKCWGANGYGQLGNGGTAASPTPVAVAGLESGVIGLAAHGGHSCALLATGGVKCWGAGDFGQIGHGASPSLVQQPQDVIGLSGKAVAIAAGWNQSCALLASGTVECWGGQLTIWEWYGPRLAPATTSAAAVKGLADMVALAAGNGETCAASRAGAVWCWTATSYARLPGSTDPLVDPMPVSGLPNVVAFGLGGGHRCASTKAGAVFCWGDNVYGQVGNGRTAAQDTPVEIVPAGATAVAAGPAHSCAVVAGGLQCWGDNRSGQLGNGESGVQTAALPVVEGSGEPQTGWWWNPAESGRGFFLEKRGNTLYLAGFLYEADGRATWFAGGGALAGSRITLPMTGFARGQTLTGGYRAPTVLPSRGDVSLQFETPTVATLTWPGGTVRLQRYRFDHKAVASDIQSGWWWNADEPGRGFAIEVQGGNAYVGGFMYDDAGDPVWYVAGGALADRRLFRSNWAHFTGGQAMGAPYRPARLTDTQPGGVTLSFPAPDSALLSLPDGRVVKLRRFVF